MSLETILQLGDDQISSQYLIIFPNGVPGGGNAEQLALRQEGSFDPPMRSTGVYDVWRQGQKVTKTNVVDETEKTFNLVFRLDQGWATYNTINAWYTLVYDEELGTADNDLNTRVPMLVQALGANKGITKTLEYGGVKIKSLKIAEFNHETGDPIKLECEFIFLRAPSK